MAYESPAAAGLSSFVALSGTTGANAMRIELLYFDGCPSHEALLPRLREIVAELAPGADIELRRIETLDHAENQRFLGSPTVRVDGADIEPAAADRTDFGLKCRLYRSEDGASGLPPEQWLRHAIESARTT